MKVKASTLVSTPELDEMNDMIVDAIRDIKGTNIIKIDLSELDDAPAKFFIIAEGESTVQVKSIASNVNKRLRKELGHKSGHLEGMKDAKWVLIDYFDTIVHIFYPETRQFYDIEGLWSDANFTEYQDL